MLAGEQTISQSMFGFEPSGPGPSSDDMVQARERIMYDRHVKITGHHVRLFDLHDAEQLAAYETLMGVLLLGVQARTHVIWQKDRQLITRNGQQGWVYFIEWTEYKLEEKATPAVGG